MGSGDVKLRNVKVLSGGLSVERNAAGATIGCKAELPEILGPMTKNHLDTIDNMAAFPFIPPPISTLLARAEKKDVEAERKKYDGWAMSIGRKISEEMRLQGCPASNTTFEVKRVEIEGNWLGQTGRPLAYGRE